MKRNTEFIVDARTERELRAEVRRLASTYTPEWRFDTENPDIASTIAMIYLSQMQGNIDRLNRKIDKLHTEFVNMLGVTLLPAFPASGVAVLRLIQGTVPGLQLPKGTKLQGQAKSEDAHNLIFETTSDVFITSAQLTDIVGISGTFGKIIPFLGGPLAPEILRVPESRSDFYAVEGLPALAGTIPLFDYSAEGVQRNAALIYHRTVFDTDEAAEVQIELRGDDAKTAAEALADTGAYVWSFLSEQGLTPFGQVSVENGVLTLRKHMPALQVELAGASYGLVCVEAKSRVSAPISVTGMGLSSRCHRVAPDFVCRTDSDLDSQRFMPFGTTASIFEECYIGHDRIFGQEGALVSLHMKLSTEQKLVTFTPQQEADSLKVIKRKPRVVPFETVATSPQEIELEYFNGIGWRRLPALSDWSTLFDGSFTGDVTLEFRCPEGWTPMVAGGYLGRSIRMRITRADNCYLQPCMHTMPVVEELTISYRYEDCYKQPHLLQTICGTQIHNHTAELLSGESVQLLSPLPYRSNALYLGFDGPANGGPVSLLFDVAEAVHFSSSPIQFEYSAIGGWKPLKVVDSTAQMSLAGIVMFMPPSDMAPQDVEGVYRYWLRMIDFDSSYDTPGRYHPAIRAIYTNAVEIRNVETRDEESFFIKAPVPNMKFPISADNILSAEVFVNERNRFSQAVMNRMKQEDPDNVRCEYNLVADVRDFFVRWTEVENFDGSAPDDRHYAIDRLSNQILFGDGVNVLIPTVRDGVAFTVRVQCCDGEAGNLRPGAVNALRGNPLYIESVYNPIATYAGSNIESLQSAHLRGANILGSHNRLVSEQDYVRAVYSFSNAVHRVRCVIGQDMEGNKNPELITIAVMMKDYMDGPYSFSNIKQRMKERLLTSCEATLLPEHIAISEPIYLPVSVSVWIQTDEPHRAFDIQNGMLERLQDYFNPLSENGGCSDIGALPSRDRLEVLLGGIQGEARVLRFLATARYSDHDGVHECSMEDLAYNPFFMPISGEHRIYIEMS